MEQVGQATRRGVLAAAVALPLAAAGCQGLGVLGTPPRPLPDVTVLRDAIDGETQLIAQYTAVLAAQPGMAGLLAPLLGQHRAHLGRLRARLIVPRGAAATPSPSRRARVQVPGSAPTAQALLQQAESSAAQSLLGRLAAASPSLAQLLASIAASEASHALLLGPGRGAG
jgi:hypothetical protein